LNSHAEADKRRDEQRGEDLLDLHHVDAADAGVALHQRVGDADADDRTDHGVRTGGGQAAPPGGKVPDDGRYEQSEDHGEARAGANFEDELYGQKIDDRVGDRTRGEKHADEVHDTGVDDGDVRLKRVGVNASGNSVRSIVEAVDELKAERNKERHAQKDEWKDRGRVDKREVRAKMGANVNQPGNEHDTKDDASPFANGRLFELLIQNGFCVG
jgi:hypothetical protein